MSIEEFGDIHDVVVIGAGAAGVGVALALRHAGIERYVVLERDKIGASFADWPAETRFITPSFPTNSVGMLDLNSIAIGVSPGWSMEVEHPSGQHYAEHLRAVAEHFELPVIEGVAVTNVIQTGKHFLIETSETALRAKHVIWATGEFQFPQTGNFPGSELCRHTATIDSYETLDADDLVFIIGGFESGIDAAYHLACNNKESWVFDAGAPWENNASDPSVAVSPFTMERMREAVFGEHVTLNPNAPVVSVTRHDSVYIVTTKDGASYRTGTQPLYAGGFDGCHDLIREMFELREDGFPALDDNDQSVRTPGVYLVGPGVRHDDHIFCFIFKYRQRFAVVAKAIATSLGLPAEELEQYRLWGMYLDDLSCCGEDCVC